MSTSILDLYSAILCKAPLLHWKKPSTVLNRKPITELRSVTCHREFTHATRRKWTRPAITPANHTTWYSIYLPGRMEGWVDLGSLIAARPGIEPTTAWSQVQRPNCTAVESPKIRSLLAYTEIFFVPEFYCRILYSVLQGLRDRLVLISRQLLLSPDKLIRFKHDAVTPLLCFVIVSSLLEHYSNRIHNSHTNVGKFRSCIAVSL